MHQKITRPISEMRASALDRRTFVRRSLARGTAFMAGSLLPRRFMSAAFASDSAPIVETPAGKVRGAAINGVQTFKGIPYGASTAGASRFLPPKAPKPWTGVRDTLDYGSPAPQDSSLDYADKELQAAFAGAGNTYGALSLGPGTRSE